MAIDVKGYVQNYAEANGLRFSYLEWGRAGALPVVLLHGLTGLAHVWDVVAAALQDDYHLFALDQRGHGDTQWPEPPAYSTDDYDEDLAALADVWGLDRFVLVGLAMGAHNGLAFAAKYRDRLVKLVAIEIPPALSVQEDGVPQAHAADPPQVVFGSIEEMFARARSTNRIASDEMLRHRVEHNARQLPDGSWTFKYSLEAGRFWRPENLWKRLPSIACPTLVVRGGASVVLPPDVAEQEAAAIPGGRLVSIAGSGHPVSTDKPHELAASIRAFLEE